MRRSFGGGGGGGVIKTFQRFVRAGGINTTTKMGGEKTRKALTLSSSVNMSFLPLICSDESEWECVDGIEHASDHVFESVPSTEEVHRALSALQQALALRCSRGDEEEVEVGLSLAAASDVVYDTFHLLETEPSVQRMVVSLSSDKVVWDAIMKNEVVKELRGGVKQKSDGGFLGWIVIFAKQLLDKIAEVVNNPFKEKKKKKKKKKRDDVDAGFDHKLKTSFFLSIVVVLIVVLARIKTTNAL